MRWAGWPLEDVDDTRKYTRLNFNTLAAVALVLLRSLLL